MSSSTVSRRFFTSAAFGNTTVGSSINKVALAQPNDWAWEFKRTLPRTGTNIQIWRVCWKIELFSPKIITETLWIRCIRSEISVLSSIWKGFSPRDLILEFRLTGCAQPPHPGSRHKKISSAFSRPCVLVKFPDGENIVAVS
jgi:hypothetical protein